MASASLGSPIGRCAIYPADRMEFVLEGVDDNGRACWRTYIAEVSSRGELGVNLSLTDYQAPDDWPVPAMEDAPHG